LLWATDGAAAWASGGEIVELGETVVGALGHELLPVIYNGMLFMEGWLFSFVLFRDAQR